MKIILNPYMPAYIKQENIRFGNFPETGITCECGKELLDFLINIKEPKEYSDVITEMEPYFRSKEETIEFVDYLFLKGLIVNYDEYCNLKNSKFHSRELLFFKMFDIIKEIEQEFLKKKIMILRSRGYWKFSF